MTLPMKNYTPLFYRLFVGTWLVCLVSLAQAEINPNNPWHGLQRFFNGNNSGLRLEPRKLASAGNFDYYLLALSWSPAYCLLQADHAPQDQCGYKRFGFVVHGLWPQFEKGYPSSCDAHPQPVPDDVAKNSLPIMPSRALIEHEWAKHGTCSGLSVNAYFTAIDQAYSSVNIPSELKDLQTALRVNPSDLAMKIQQANPSFPPNAMAINCKSGQLSEVYLCLDKQLQARTCSAEVLKRQCKYQTIIVPPLR